jgi:hypothetical protein
MLAMRLLVLAMARLLDAALGVVGRAPRARLEQHFAEPADAVGHGASVGSVRAEVGRSSRTMSTLILVFADPR